MTLFMTINKSSFTWSETICNTDRLTPPRALALQNMLRTYPMKGFELEMLGRLLRGADFIKESNLPTLRVALVGGYTTEPIANAVCVALLLIGYCAEVYEAPFGVYRQEMYDPCSALYAFKPQVILIIPPAADIASAPHRPLAGSDVDFALRSEVEHWLNIWSEIRRYSDAVILQHLFETSDHVMLGLAERRISWSPTQFVSELNRRLITESTAAVLWVDVETLATLVGKNNWHDPRFSHHGKFAFSPKFLPEYTKLVEGVFRSALAKGRKALIVDLDNTLWGGVVGDDGLDGIKLGPETPEGEAYFAFCQYIANLGRRGVILGICSKNEMNNVSEVFERHRHMPLSLDEFSIVRCNWQDKAQNLAAIALELNIDPSAIVFVDDNPAECELVRRSIPTMHVVQLDGDVATFIRRLDRERLFDSQEFSAEDLSRTQSYKARSDAELIRTSATDLDAYLSSLQMIGQVWLAGSEDLSRLTQMEAKTNQFNLTTRRWTSTQLRDFMIDINHDVLCFRMTDRFADHGLVGSMVIRYEGDTVIILSWILSCRVFSRTCEEFMARYLMQSSIKRQFSKIIGEFSGTEKNRMFESLYSRLGFTACLTTNTFVCDLTRPVLPRTYISSACDV